MSDPRTRQPLPLILNGSAPLDRLAERCRRIAELSDQLAAMIRELDKVSPSEAANLYVLAGRVTTMLLAGVNAGESR